HELDREAQRLVMVFLRESPDVVLLDLDLLPLPFLAIAILGGDRRFDIEVGDAEAGPGSPGTLAHLPRRVHDLDGRGRSMDCPKRQNDRADQKPDTHIVLLEPGETQDIP